MNKYRQHAIATALSTLGILFPSAAKAQAPVTLSPVEKRVFLGTSGVPLASGCVFTYISGTTTNQATYVDSGGITTNANPVILDAAGRADIWLDTTKSYKFKIVSAGGVNCASGVTQWTVDNITALGASTILGANNVFTGNNTFSGTNTFSNPIIGSITGNAATATTTATATSAAGLTGNPAISVSSINNKIYCGTQAGATADIKLNACIAAVLAAGGGTADATDLGGVQTIAAQVNLGNTVGTGVPITLLVPSNAVWNVTITSGGTACGIRVFNNGNIIAQDVGTGQTATLQSFSAATNVQSLICTDESQGGITNSFRIDGLFINNTAGATIGDAAVSLRACKDQSLFANNLVVNPSGVDVHVGGSATNANCGVLTAMNNWLAGSNGLTNNTTSQPLWIQGSTTGGTTSSIRWYGGSIVQPGKGKNNVFIDGGTNFFVNDVNFYGTHLEGTIHSAPDTTPMVNISHAGPVTWVGGAMFQSPLQQAQNAYCFSLTNSANSLQVVGVTCGAGSGNMVNNVVTGINAKDAGSGTINYYSDFPNNFFGSWTIAEGSAPLTSGTGVHPCYADSSQHIIKCNDNGGTNYHGVRTTEVGTCTLSGGTCTVTWSAAFNATPLCNATWNGTGALTGIIKAVPSATNCVITSSVGGDTAVMQAVGTANPN